jgi:hypothetical protein
MVEVVVSMSGSWLPRTAKPNAIGSAVPRMRDVPEKCDEGMGDGHET